MHTLSDTTRRASLPLLAALLGVFAFAGAADAASLSCTQSGDDVLCDYDATGEDPDYALFNVENQGVTGSSPSETGQLLASGYCASELVGPNPHFELRDGYTGANSGVNTLATDDVVCAEPPSGGSCDGTGANLMLCTLVSGATGFFYDNAAGLIVTVISVAIVFGLVRWLLRRLPRNRRRF